MRAALATAVLLCAAPALAEEAPARGEDIFALHCARCHEIRTEAPDLGVYDGSVDDLLFMLENGFYPMPSFEGQFSDEELQALWGYLSRDKD